MSNHQLPRSSLAQWIRRLSVPIALFWLALAAITNAVVPQLEEVAKEQNVSLSPQDAPSLQAMKRMGKVFHEFDSDSVAMVVLEGDKPLADDAHRFYDTMVHKLSQDTKHVQTHQDFWGDPLTASGSQSADGKAAYVQAFLAGNQGGTLANESVDAVRDIVAGTPPPPGVKAYVTGAAPLIADQFAVGSKGTAKVTVITLAVITVMLFFVYRSVVTVALALVMTLASRCFMGSHFGAFDPKRKMRTSGWQESARPSCAVRTHSCDDIRGGPDRSAALPGYKTSYDARLYLPTPRPMSATRLLSGTFEARLNPELPMIETDHDMRNPADMLILERVAKAIFHTPGIALVQSMTRPLGTPLDHSSIPFQISAQSFAQIENLKYQQDRAADLLKQAAEIDKTIAILQQQYALQQQSAAATR
jgi:uncharacterized membrane protein YdfJ with MMPL/SSD domain